MQISLARVYTATLSILAVNANVWEFNRESTHCMQFNSSSAKYSTYLRALPTANINLSGTTAGNYGVYNCGPDDSLNLIELFSSLKAALQPALANLLLPVSSPAYTVFFKDINRAPFVRDVLQKVATGTPVPPISGHGIAQAPTMFCTTGENQAAYTTAAGVRKDTYAFCMDHPRVSAYIWLGSAITVLCPKFFQNPVAPVRSARACLSVDPHFDIFDHDTKGFSDYQLWILLHELVHYYTHAIGDGVRDDEPEASALANYCLMIPSRMAVNHAYSYVYFVADIWLGCTEFPTVRTEPPRHGGSIELLEVDSNWTLANATIPAAPRAENVSNHDRNPLAGAKNSSTLPFWAK